VQPYKDKTQNQWNKIVSQQQPFPILGLQQASEGSEIAMI
jgi:hypothetical protein